MEDPRNADRRDARVPENLSEKTRRALRMAILAAITTVSQPTEVHAAIPHFDKNITHEKNVSGKNSRGMPSESSITRATHEQNMEDNIKQLEHIYDSMQPVMVEFSVAHQQYLDEVGTVLAGIQSGMNVQQSDLSDARMEVKLSHNELLERARRAIARLSGLGEFLLSHMVEMSPSETSSNAESSQVPAQRWVIDWVQIIMSAMSRGKMQGFNEALRDYFSIPESERKEALREFLQGVVEQQKQWERLLRAFPTGVNPPPVSV